MCNIHFSFRNKIINKKNTMNGWLNNKDNFNFRFYIKMPAICSFNHLGNFLRLTIIWT